MESFIKVMKALGDSNRVKIIKLLQKKTMCVCELQAALKLAQPAVSKHLKILEDARLVASRKEGLWVNYSLSDGRANPYAAGLLENLRRWLDDDIEIAELLSHLPCYDRYKICAKNE